MNNCSNRLCISCDKRFGTSRGLDDHRARNKECGTAAKKIAKARKIKELRLRNKSIDGLRLKRIRPHKKKLSTKRKRGAPLSREEKEFVLHNYDQYRSKKFQCCQLYRPVQANLQLSHCDCGYFRNFLSCKSDFT